MKSSSTSAIFSNFDDLVNIDTAQQVLMPGWTGKVAVLSGSQSLIEPMLVGHFMRRWFTADVFLLKMQLLVMFGSAIYVW